MPKRGCGILFFRKAPPAVLVFLRDDKPGIPFPGYLDILGGRLQDDERPSEAIVREIAEELTDLRTGEPFRLENFELFTVFKEPGASMQHSIYFQEADFEIKDLKLNEGQRLQWLGKQELRRTTLAFGFSDVVARFFANSWIK